MVLKLCKNHPNRKAQARGLCKCCYDKWLKENNPQYKERQLINHDKWASRPENKERMRQWYRERELRRKNDPEYIAAKRNRMLRKKYGITSEDYERILAEQGGGCALCGRKQVDQRFHVDHDHDTKRIRGILCHQCNWYMGTIDSDPDIIIKIIKYLQLPYYIKIEDRSIHHGSP